MEQRNGEEDKMLLTFRTKPPPCLQARTHVAETTTTSLCQLGLSPPLQHRPHRQRRGYHFVSDGPASASRSASIHGGMSRPTAPRPPQQQQRQQRQPPSQTSGTGTTSSTPMHQPTTIQTKLNALAGCFTPAAAAAAALGTPPPPPAQAPKSGLDSQTQKASQPKVSQEKKTTKKEKKKKKKKKNKQQETASAAVPPSSSAPAHTQPLFLSRHPPGANFQKTNTNTDTKHDKNNKNTKTTKTTKTRAPPSTASGGVPSPSARYLAQTLPPPCVLPSPRRLLVVLDLNGTLLHRPSSRQPCRFVKRPHAQQFLAHCLESFHLAIWSSAQPKNVSNMVGQLLTTAQRGRCVVVWARDRLGLSADDYHARVQVYKRLSRLWDDPAVRASHPEAADGGRWDQSNTVLVDDSLEKGRSEPYNILCIPEFVGLHAEPSHVLPQVQDYLSRLTFQADVSRYMRATPFTLDPGYASTRVVSRQNVHAVQ
ncbi:hypothetical protein E4U41_002127 [Claviceps citrina]|nr:hypothetical protein E4U41_002127 [Claviceps citrina]